MSADWDWGLARVYEYFSRPAGLASLLLSLGSICLEADSFT